jgi:hypothetical protein
MRMALKEWAIIVDGLESGRQDVLLRKGGIAEGPGGFHTGHDRFFLYPTRFHQQRDRVVSSAQARFDTLAAGWGDESTVRIQSWAELLHTRWLETPAELAALRPRHLWADTVVAERFAAEPAAGLHLLELRVWNLPRPYDLPVRNRYGGCRSWIELDAELDTAGSTPVAADPTSAG